MKGFLPTTDPLTELPREFRALEQLAAELPKLLVSHYTRSAIENLPALDYSALESEPQLERAMMLLSYLGQSYVWADLNHPATVIPAVLAVPWYEVAQQLSRPPILSYASYALYNWRRIDPAQPVELGNIALLQNFLGGIDEEWFILIHVDIEAKAIPAIEAILPALSAASSGNSDKLHQELKSIEQSLEKMCATLRRMPEYCDPYIYYRRVRPYIHGWKNNPALADGVIYQDVEAYQNKPVKFKGETGAQSSIIPVLDAVLGVEHHDNPLKVHLLEMIDYMPKSHREFLLKIQQNNSIRPFIQKNHRQFEPLRETYNRCLQYIHEFRTIHFNYAASYIQKQNQATAGNPTSVGTGGTPFMDYLRQHKEETERHLI